MSAQSHLTNDCGCQLSRIGTPTLATVVVLTVLGLGVICWIINSPDRCDRVSRILLARRGDASCLDLSWAPPFSVCPLFAPGPLDSCSLTGLRLQNLVVAASYDLGLVADCRVGETTITPTWPAGAAPYGARPSVV